MKANQYNSQLLLTQLHDVVQAIDKAGDQILRSEKGLSFAQFKILTTVHDRPQASQRDVARCLKLSPPAISRHIDNLISAGLVTSRVNPRNRREHLLGLSVQGQKALQSAWQLLSSRFSSAMAVLNPADQKHLITMLDRLLGQVSVGR